MNIKKYIQESIEVKDKILNDECILNDIQTIVNEIVKCYKKGRRVYVAGNGGSASDAQHFVTELVSKFLLERAGLSAFALSSNTSILTAISNDYGYEKSFSRQIQAYGEVEDIFVAISTSGNSQNIVSALIEAKQKEMITIGLTGQAVCEMDSLCDYLIKVPSISTPIIQEVHIMIEHIISALVEEKLFKI